MREMQEEITKKMQEFERGHSGGGVAKTGKLIYNKNDKPMIKYLTALPGVSPRRDGRRAGTAGRRKGEKQWAYKG
jgi:hypothetical protein